MGRDNRERILVRYLFASLVFVLAFVSTSQSSLDVTTDAEHLSSGDIAAFSIDITNTGETPLDPVTVQDTLPVGMSYVSDNCGGLAEGQRIDWQNIGRLEVGGSTQIKLVARIGPGIRGWLTNFVTVTGTPPTGYNVMDNDTARLFVKAPAKRRSVNEDSLVVGDQSAFSVNPFGRGDVGNYASAENYNDIQKVQTRKMGSSHWMKILAVDESATALYSASAINKRRIKSMQG